MDPYAVAGLPNVIAVNRAFYWLDGDCDAWCVGEHPTRKDTTTAFPGQLWHPAPFKDDWAWSMAPHRYPYSIHDTAAPMTNGCVPARVDPGWRGTASWCGGTTLHALAGCCRRGAKSIALIGCDMAGIGGWGYTDTKHSKEWWDKRWETERKSLDAVTQEAAQHGVTITRLLPLDLPSMSTTLM